MLEISRNGNIDRRPTGPFRFEPAKAEMPVNAGPRPIGWIADVAMFNGIEMDVVAIAKTFALVADQVFPESALPNAAFAASPSIGTDRLVPTARCQEYPGESKFDLGPADGEIRVALRKHPDAMQVIGQQYCGKDFDGVLSSYRLKCVAEDAAGGRFIEQRTPSIGDDGEEICRGFGAPAAVLGHNGIVSRRSNPGGREKLTDRATWRAV